MTATKLAKVRSSKLLQGSAWILIGLGLQSILGFAFLILASRVGSKEEVGRATALFTAIQFVNYASGLGLTVALARHATDPDGEADALFTWGIVATVASSILGGGIYLALAGSDAVHLVTGSFAGWAIFCAYTAGTSVGLLVDVRLMAARRWGWLVGRIAITGLIRLPLALIDRGSTTDVWLYHLMLAPLAISGVVAVPLLARVGAGTMIFRRPKALAPFARYSGVNWLASLASQGPQFALPLLVAQSVPSGEYANFFLAWTVTGLVFLVPGAISQVLLVEGSKDAVVAEAQARESGVPAGAVRHEPATGRAKEALVFSFGLASVAWLGSLLAGPVVDAVFGHAYDETAHLLPRLMAAGIPWAITSVRLSEARIRRDQLATVAITITLGLGILLPAVLWVPDAGTEAATRAWFFGNLAACIVAVVVHQRSRRRVPHLAAVAA